MKRLVVKHPENCVQCHTCEDCCALAFYKVFNPELSCIRIDDDRMGAEAIRFCNQCGICESVCPIGAISRNDKGVYMINKEICVGCLACLEACPQQVICRDEEQTKASKCIACGICVKNCPMDVLAIENVE